MGLLAEYLSPETGKLEVQLPVRSNGVKSLNDGSNFTCVNFWDLTRRARYQVSGLWLCVLVVLKAANQTFGQTKHQDQDTYKSRP